MGSLGKRLSRAMMKRFASCVGVCIVTLVFAVTSRSYAEESADEIQKKLSVLRNKIESTERELIPIRKDEEAARLQQNRVEGELRVLRRNEQSNEKEIGSLQEDERVARADLQKLETQLALRNTFLRQRLAFMYKTRRRLAPIALLVGSDSVASLHSRFVYLKYLVAEDREQVEEFLALSSAKQASVDGLQDVQRIAEVNRIKLQETREEIEAKKLEIARLGRELKEQRKRVEARLRTLRSEEAEYERLVQSLLSGIESSEDTESYTPKVTGREIFRPHALAAPVAGTIVQHFGKQKHSQFQDSIFVKGVEVSANANAEVQAVGPGKIVFDAVLPGFGNVLIVDHGDSFFSLYGRIRPSRARGDTIEAGDVLGSTTLPDEYGRNFYFEVRKDRKPVDPERFLRRDAYN